MGHIDWVRDVAWAPSLGLPKSTLASAGQDGKALIWAEDASSGTWLPTELMQSEVICARSLTPFTVVMCCNGTLVLLLGGSASQHESCSVPIKTYLRMTLQEQVLGSGGLMLCASCTNSVTTEPGRCGMLHHGHMVPVQLQHLMLQYLQGPVWRVSWSVTGNILAVSDSKTSVSLWKEALDGQWQQISA